MDDLEILWITLNCILVVYTLIICICVRKKLLNDNVNY